MIDTLLHLLFPERCQGCNTPGIALCSDCLKTIPLSDTIYSTENAYALYTYEHPIVRRAIWELKYFRKSSLTKVLAEGAADRIAAHITGPVILVPIPQHYTKTFSRGFNQSVSIAKWIQKIVPETTVSQVLKKVRSTTAQAKTQSKAERAENMMGTMVSKKILDDTAVYVLVDDVITTGSTIYEASRALRAAGAEHIYCVAIAHGSAISRNGLSA
ncbi:MAG: amidophosphoribosyltransferase-like protein [Candidatus Nomurabacteria bacterium]|nr:amidophosphoribosyltransferase-like protein [Candidatus Nomurabacteria bacterium]